MTYFFIYKGVLVEIKWNKYMEVYHWFAYKSNLDYHNNQRFTDSLKQVGFETKPDAISHAKQEIDFLIEE